MTKNFPLFRVFEIDMKIMSQWIFCFVLLYTRAIIIQNEIVNNFSFKQKSVKDFNWTNQIMWHRQKISARKFFLNFHVFDHKIPTSSTSTLITSWKLTINKLSFNFLRQIFYFLFLELFLFIYLLFLFFMYNLLSFSHV